MTRSFTSTAEDSANKAERQWLNKTTTLIIERMREKILEFEATPHEGTSAPTIEQQERKFQFLKKLIEENESGIKKRGPLTRIIRGFLTEFIRQSENEIPACNITNGRNPEVAAYWQTKTSGEFHDAMIPGVFHSAVSYNRIRDYASVNERSASFHAIGEIVRTTIDMFKEEYPKLNPNKKPTPSVYNDHREVIRLALHFRDAQTAIR